jgi:hypothetical protein
MIVMKKNLYNWYEEPDNVRIKIKSTTRKKILKQAIEKVGGCYKLSRIIRISPQTVYNYLNGVSMRVGSLKNILNLLGIPYENITTSVIELSWLKYPKLPFKLNSTDGAILFGAFLSDGSNTSRVMYKNKEEVMLKKIERALKNTFGSYILIDRRISKEGIPYILTSQIVSRVLSKSGIPKGKKIKLNLSLPTFILNGSKKIQRMYLKQVFDDEGDVNISLRRVTLTRCIDVTKLLPGSFINSLPIKKPVGVLKIPFEIKTTLRQNPPKLLAYESKLLNGCNIKNRIRLKQIIKQPPGYVTAVWNLIISKKENIFRFKKEVGFTIPSKSMQLYSLLNSYIKKRSLDSKLYEKLIIAAKNETKKKGYFTIEGLISSTKLPYNSVKKRLNRLRRLNKVKLIQQAKYTFV